MCIILFPSSYLKPDLCNQTLHWPRKKLINSGLKSDQILWVSRQSRPDTIFDACHLASSLKNATVNNILEANKVIKRFKSETVELKFQHLGDITKVQLLAFSDASLGNLPDGGSQGGNFIVLLGEKWEIFTSMLAVKENQMCGQEFVSWRNLGNGRRYWLCNIYCNIVCRTYNGPAEIIIDTNNMYCGQSITVWCYENQQSRWLKRDSVWKSLTLKNLWIMGK